MPDEQAIKNHPAERHLFLWRVLTTAAIMLVLLGILVARLGWLQIARHDYNYNRARNNRMRVEIVPPVRGLIYDRNGRILAQNLPAYRLVVIPEQVDDMDAALERLSHYINVDDQARERVRQHLRASANFRAVPIRLDLSEREVARFEVNRHRFPGMEIRAGLSRHYPLGPVTAHLIGYIGEISNRETMLFNGKRYRGSTRVGKVGVERSHESLLHGYPGSRIVETNALGRTIHELEYNPPESGKNLYLTIDADLQTVAYHALGDRSGAVVAIEPGTGEVLAMVSKPSFDPGLFTGGISSAAYNKLLNAPGNPLYNRATQGQYPPGSVIKPVMAIAALESGVITADEKVWCPGYITLKGSSHRYRDWLRSGHGWVNMREAIYRSSDVYFYKQGMKMGIDTIHKYSELFGLGRRTGIDLPQENSGIVPSRAWKHAHYGTSWFPGETLITTIGQGYMTATPLQLAHMTSILAEHGRGHIPHLLKAVHDPISDELEQMEPRPTKPITLENPAHWGVVMDGMYSVINAPRGTAHYYVGQDLAYPMAGKSGTAQVAEIKQNVIAPDIDEMPYNRRPHALFIAFAPVQDPQIAVAAIVEHGGGGSSVAGPITRAVIDAYMLDTPAVQQVSSEPRS